MLLWMSGKERRKSPDPNHCLRATPRLLSDKSENTISPVCGEVDDPPV